MNIIQDMVHLMESLFMLSEVQRKNRISLHNNSVNS